VLLASAARLSPAFVPGSRPDASHAAAAATRLMLLFSRSRSDCFALVPSGRVSASFNPARPPDYLIIYFVSR
jgi:hypothetical protein